MARPRKKACGFRRRPGDAVLVAGLVILAAFTLAVRPPSPDDGPGARSLQAARRAVARDPLQVSALRRLGIALARAGRADDADAIFEFAGARGWRDTPAQAWLLRRRVATGDLAAAFASADALLRRDIDPALRTRILALLVAAAQDAHTRILLVAHLASSPPWRPDFLSALAAAPDLDAARATLLQLARSARPPSTAEIAPYIARRIAAGEERTAWLDWRTLEHETRAFGEAMAPEDPPPFGWSAAQGAGADSEVEAASGAREAVLRVGYDGEASPVLPKRLLALAPGRYVLTWRERVEAEAPPRLHWALRCAGAGPFLGSGGGTQAARLDFQVPGRGCEGQWLVLTADPGERRAPSVSLYDGFRLRRAD